jgi:Protein of unknown function (DUF3800)
MAHSFIAYVDESGDDGLPGTYRTAGHQGGSSNWLTISAALWRYSRDLEAVQWRDEILNKLPEQKRKRRELHCSKLSHEQRLMACHVLAAKPIRSVCVMANKPVIPVDVYTQKNQLYFYMSRYLIERISWFCRDARPGVQEGDGRVKIIFSRRGGLSYPGFRGYLTKLRDGDQEGIEIHWNVIDIGGIEARDHASRAGLQIVDLIATCVSAGLEPNAYGNCELRYARVLRSVIYHRRDNYLSYGVKLVPRASQIPLTREQQEFVDFFAG